MNGLFIGGEWAKGGPPIEVRNKYDGTVFATVTSARMEDVDAAIGAAARAAPEMARMPAWRRAEILARASEGIRARREELARTIATEAGKALKFARVEVDRAVQTFLVASEEAKRLHGETIPLDAAPAGEGYFGFWQRRPIGVVAAIAPFNFPLNLVAHKVAPALAAGNTVVLKPATSTPMSSVLLCEILHAAGLPPGAINLVVGSGATVGDRLVADPRVGKVTFTGSAPVGRHIVARAGIKKVTLELGNASPVIVAPDADLDLVAKRCALGAFYNSGQVCLSVQRVYGDRSIAEPFLEKLALATEAMVVGDPLDENVDVGPMINVGEVDRAQSWVEEAVADGARIVSGGRREGPVYWPTLLDNVRPGMKVMDQEVFAPIASFVPYDDFEQALAAANASDYGLQAAVFTRDIGRVLAAIRTLDFGGVIINDTPTFRVDHMPYGGMRQSGIGREGVRFAMEEMTNIQVIAIKG
jgi:acyl-CoA reductase-like NAD-dependent aldehyde dehydrogenase